MNVLMVSVGAKRVGGMWTVAEEYINDLIYNSKVRLKYVATSTNGSIFTRILYMIIGYIKILWILENNPIDIVHVHMAEKGSTFRKGRVVKWARHKNKKVIIHLHAGPFMAWYKTISVDKQRKVRQIFNLADCIFVLGEYWKKELTSIISEEKIVIVYNGVKCPEQNLYNPNARNIVYFGVMKKEKGIYDLINSILLIDNELPDDIKVVLCGNDLEGDIQDTIEKVGLKNRFELLGWVRGKEKEEVYNNAMINVLPSYYEGLSMTVLEAMANGVPVITTNISTMPEVLGEEGLMIEPGNVEQLSQYISMLISDEKKRVKYSCIEYERVKVFFSMDVLIEKTLVCYLELLNK